MFNILITDDLSPQGLALLEAADDVSFDIKTGLAEADLISLIPVYDGLIIRSSVSVTEGVLNAARKLRVIGRAGVGIDNVNLDQASLLGIIVMNTPGANSLATAEHTLAMLMALSRRIPQAYRALGDGHWDRKPYVGTQLYGKTIGLVGLGRVGSNVAQRCQAFGMKVLAYDPYISDDVARQQKVTLVDLDELFGQSDFISLHTALTAETEEIINAATIAQMKTGVYVINCARGALINEADLVEALNKGKIAGAALDVFAVEPLPADSPLRGHANIIFTPHLAASTIEAQADVSTQIVSQVLDALREVEYRNAVNMPLTDPAVFRKLKPFIDLAEKVGSLHTQLTPKPIKKIEVEFQGELKEHVKLLTVAILRGLLTPILSDSVNYINAPHLAHQRGIAIAETTGFDTPDYPNLISCRAIWEGDDRLLAATVFHTSEPRIVQLDQYRLDLRPEGRILVVDSIDIPGVIGKMGMILGEAGVNIASMRLGRVEPGGEVLTFIKIDNEASPETIARLEATEPIKRVRQVVL